MLNVDINLALHLWSEKGWDELKVDTIEGSSLLSQVGNESRSPRLVLPEAVRDRIGDWSRSLRELLKFAEDIHANHVCSEYLKQIDSKGPYLGYGR
jgi:hypothetical protein